MLINRVALILILGIVSLLGLACMWERGESYDIEKTSPTGEYRARIEIRAEEGKDTTRGYVERGKYLFFKNSQIVHTYEWRNPYQYEPTFRDSSPIIEWVGDTALRMGKDRSDQPFYDRLIVYNNTDNTLKYIDVNYGKSESFWLFDIAPREQITVEASPAFKPDGTSNHWLGYGGASENGRRFEGTLEKKQRTSSSDGLLTFQITINDKDLK